MKAINIEKTPAEVLYYNFDFKNWPTFKTDTIASATATNWAGGALTGITTTVVASSTVVQLKVSGGTASSFYYIRILATPTVETSLRAEADVILTVGQPPIQ